MVPLSVNKSGLWRGDQYQQPDAPFVSTKPAGQVEFQPFLPGSSIRGALRHATSRLMRARKCEVADPNFSGDAEAQRLRDHLKGKQESGEPLSDHVTRALADPVTQVFGLEELCARGLVSDAALASKDYAFTLARAEHHAEDEFTAGVYGSGKFDSDLLLQGPMQFRIVAEAPTLEELRSMAETLAPALELARLGHLPIGGGKWRGAGWVPWQIGPMELARIGDRAGRAEDPAQAVLDRSLVDRLRALLSGESGG
ncbi:MAG: RAMP superfamily CRISPR-associated protein [Thermoguttaceae bacterium]|nr:RAMP superfamily CRISPR-associated protein [Thermoguttaceae bacterium]